MYDGHLHPSAYCVFHVTATSGSIIELYRQFLSELGIDTASFSKAVLLKRIRREIMELVCGKKIQSVLVIDEASLLRLEVLAEIHTLCQFEQDSKPWLPLIMAGQANLVDKLLYRASLPGISNRRPKPPRRRQPSGYGNVSETSPGHRRRKEPPL